MEKDELFLESIIKQIVQFPEQVRIERSVDVRGVLLRLWVDKRDMGVIIGRQGSHAACFKLLVKLMGHRDKVAVVLKIEEPFNGKD